MKILKLLIHKFEMSNSNFQGIMLNHGKKSDVRKSKYRKGNLLLIIFSSISYSDQNFQEEDQKCIQHQHLVQNEDQDNQQ